MEVTSKRRRLSHLCAMGGVPDAALARILAQLDKAPIQGAPSRQSVARASLSEYTPDMELTIQLPLTNAPGSWQWHVCKPACLIGRSCEVSPTLRRLFAPVVFKSAKYFAIAFSLPSPSGCLYILLRWILVALQCKGKLPFLAAPL